MCLEQDARPQSEKYVGGGAEEQRTAVSERLLAVSVEAGAPGSEPVHEHLRKVEDLVVEDAKQEHLVSMLHACEPLNHLLFEVLINAFF